jgi:hypothetical protein
MIAEDLRFLFFLNKLKKLRYQCIWVLEDKMSQANKLAM